MNDLEKRVSFVALTEESAEGTPADSAVIIGNHVRPEAAGRSDMLSGVSSTQGLAGLPGQLRPEDVHLWQTACLVDCEPSTSQLSTILKVRHRMRSLLCVTQTKWEWTAPPPRHAV